MHNLEEFACFDGSTEVLTELGWIRLDTYVDLKNHPRVLSYDDGILQFKKIKKVVKKHYEGEMVRFQNKSLDMFMTPNHKVITYKKGEKQVTPAQDIVLSEHHRVVVSGIRNLGYKSLSNIDRLLIAISADGYYNQKEKAYVLSFSKPRKIERARYLLNCLDLPYTTGEHQRKHKDLPEVWFRFKLPSYVSFTKGLHNIVSLENVSTNYAREFLKEVSLWDGSKSSNCQHSINYNTNVEEEADFYSAMCVLGNSFTHKTVVNTIEGGVLKVGCNQNKSSVTLQGTKKFIPYKGNVYCVQVPDTHCFFARRGKGTPFLTHNCDTETSTLRTHGPTSEFMLVGISISWGSCNNYYIPINHLREEDYYYNADIEDVLKYLKPQFEREDIRLIAHNYKFDAHVLARVGIHIKTRDIFDTMIASWLCNENLPKGLKDNSEYRLGIQQTHFKDVTKNVPVEVRKANGLKANSLIPFQLVLIDEGAPYALDDAFYTWELYLGYENELEDEGMLQIYNQVYKTFINCMFTVEENGVVVDKPKLLKMQKDISEDCEALKYRLYELAGAEFNANSNQQKAELMFGYVKQDSVSKSGKVSKAKPNQNLIDINFGFKPLTLTAGGMPQTNNDVFWKLSKENPRDKRKREGVEFCKVMLKYSKLEKLRSAFVDGLLEQMYDDGKVHPSFNICGTDSGRISCSSPNLMQLPSADEEDKYQIRSLFIGSIDPISGNRKKILSFDYSNLEVRVLTHFSGDENLVKMFNNNEDVHGSTAVNMFELDCDPSEVKKKYPHLRQASKILNFLLLYGGSSYTLYNSLKDDHYAPIDLGDKEYLEKYNCKKGEDVAQIYIDKYFTSYKGVAQFIKDQKKLAHKQGYVQTILGRNRRLNDVIHSSNYKEVGYAERLAVNSCIQGSAADLMISAQNRIHNDEHLKSLGINMLVQIHDEVLFECPEEHLEEAVDTISYYMENMLGDKTEHLRIPFTCSSGVGDDYAEAK
jgi:DNA polymerase I-like protein with 3'-5' exonuclease and polymerase domains